MAMRPSNTAWTRCNYAAVAPDKEQNEAAKQGIAAHAEAEKRLKKNPEKPPKGHNIEGYIAYVNALRDIADRSLVEQRVTIFEKLTGSVDFSCVSGDTLHIVDLKYGKVPVDPDSPQLRQYAIGVLNHLSAWDTVKSITLTVFQPNSWVETIRSHELTVDDLQTWFDWLKGRIADIRANPDKRTAGSHCSYCSQVAMCAANISAVGGLITAASTMSENPQGRDLSTQLLVLNEALTRLKTMQSAVHTEVMYRLKNGETMTHHKLGKSYGHRKWSYDPKTLAEMVGEEVLVPMSPAQAEKIGINTEGMTFKPETQSLRRK